MTGGFFSRAGGLMPDFNVSLCAARDNGDRFVEVLRHN